MSLKIVEVSTLYKSNYRDIPKMLRKIAEDIESGNLPNVESALFVCQDSEHRCQKYSWGTNNIYEDYALASIVKQRLSSYLDVGSILKTGPTT